MKKIIIVPACTDLNRGDQVLVWEAANLVKDAYPNSECRIVDYGINQEDKERQSKQTKEFGYHVISNIVDHPKRHINTKKIHDSSLSKVKSGFVALFDFIKLLIILLFPYQCIFNLFFTSKNYRDSFSYFLQTDIVAVKGGGFIHTYGKIEDLYYLWFNFYYLILAKRLKKKIIIFPNSFGPIKGKLCKLFVKRIVNSANLVYVREKISLKVLNELGCYNIQYKYDLGYYIKPSNIFSNNSKFSIFQQIKKQKKNKIGITVRPYRFPNSSDPINNYKKYISAISKFCNNNNHNNHFYFIVQVDGPSSHELDILAINNVVSELNTNVSYTVVHEDFNCLELTTIYSLLDFLIGTRFHSIIFAHTVGIPGIAIAYGGNKTQGIMDDIELGEYVIPIENITYESLSNLYNKLIINTDDYKIKLNKLLSKINNNRNEIINDLKEL